MIVGIAATVLAALQVAAWLALGLRLQARDADSALALPAAFLIGSSITAFAYAVFAAAGLVGSGILAVAVVNILALALDWRRLLAHTGPIMRDAGELIASRGKRIATALVALVLWADSIVPPRDADVMRYHLAHIRQIIREGQWVAVPDYHYALPFGSSLNFLPFEYLNVPEAAHVTNLITWSLAIITMAAWLRRRGATTLALPLLALAVLQPYVVKSATTAMVDVYPMFVMMTLSLLLLRDLSNTRDAALLGFVALAGAQSRYQLVGAGAAAFLILGARALGGRASLRSLAFASAGALCACAVAAPFYVMNFVAFRNPVWPLLIPLVNGFSTFANRIAAAETAFLAGTFSIGGFPATIWLLLRDAITFPIAVLVVVFLSTLLWSRAVEVRRLAAFAAAFFTMWFAAQPNLYPRFILYFLPIVVIGLTLAFDESLRSAGAGVRKVMRVGFAVSGTVLFAALLWYSADSVRYLADGDLRRFHRATWYHPVYEWANDSTPRDAKFLVIVTSGHSYYLDREYRKANPEFSGVVDWEGLTAKCALDIVLAQGGFQYVIYQQREWPQPGGAQMSKAVLDAVTDGRLAIVKDFTVPLVTGRVLGTEVSATVRILRVAKACTS